MSTVKKKRAVQGAEDRVRKALEHTEQAHWTLDEATEIEHLPRCWKELIETRMCALHEAKHGLIDLIKDLEDQADVLGVAAQLAEAGKADAIAREDRAEEGEVVLGADVVDPVEENHAQLMGELRQGGVLGPFDPSKALVAEKGAEA